MTIWRIEKMKSNKQLNDLAFKQLYLARREIQTIILEDTPEEFGFNFRPYQEEISTKLKNFFNTNNLISIEVGCGLGKTNIAGYTAYKLNIFKKNRCVIWVTPNETAIGEHDKSIPNQKDIVKGNGNIKTLKRMFSSLDLGEVKKGEKRNIKITKWKDSQNFSEYDIYFFTIYDFVKLKSDEPDYFNLLLNRTGLIVLDEAHRMPEDKEKDTVIIGQINQIVRNECLNKTKVLTMTGTHYRMDKKFPLGKAKPDELITIADGIIKHRVTPEIYGITVEVQANDVEIENKKEDYVVRLGENGWNEIAEHIYMLYCNDKNAGHCAFVSRINDAVDLVGRLNKLFGREAFYYLVSNDGEGTQNNNHRQVIVNKINNGEAVGFVTVNVGVDAINIPKLTYCHLISKTKSQNKLVQCVGRVLRQHKDEKYEKKMCVVVDYHYAKYAILKGVKGIYDFAEKSGSKLTKNEIVNGGNLFRKELKVVEGNYTYKQMEELYTINSENEDEKHRLFIEDLIKRNVIIEREDLYPLSNAQLKELDTKGLLK